MPLQPGTPLGTYEILALIGAGGMGEVYRARDPKLNRLVAIKVLPAALAADEALVARFGREAKAVAALSHPNVLGIFDLATQDGLTYAVMELLEGESLRDKLRGGALPPKRAVEIAIELAQGLGAAHERGIVHRDVKPENIFITAEGRVKVLDFGLAKQAAATRGTRAELETEAMSRTPNATEAGQVLGTVGYMSPEQVKGEPADHRADIFSFGVVLYELLSGQRPFRGETAHHTLTAILDEDPPALVAARGPLPPALERLVAHCLEKHPRARFQSMADLAYALQNLSSVSGPGPGLRPRSRAGWVPAAAAVGAVAVLLGAAALAGRLHLGAPAVPPTFTRITRAPGTIESAFFGPDGKTIFFTERLQGGQPEIFVLHPGDPEPAAVGLKDALLLGVSVTGELALLREPRFFLGSLYRGMLAQAGPSGGSLKELKEQVITAAWSGNGLATLTDRDMITVTLTMGGRMLLEGPESQLTLRFLRPSRDGRALALICSNGFKSEIRSYDLDGKATVIHTKADDSTGDTLTGLAWGPDGQLWLSELQDDQTLVWSLAGNGRRRLLWRGQGSQALMDVAEDGRMLLVDQQVRRGVLMRRAGSAMDQDLSIGSGTQAFGFSADGSRLLLMESPIVDGGTAQDQVYLWKAGGAPPARLGQGTCWSLSPDGRWINLSYSFHDPRDLDPEVAAALGEVGLEARAVLDTDHPAACMVFIPTGVGKPIAMNLSGTFTGSLNAFMLPDGKGIIFSGEAKDGTNWWSMPLKGGVPTRLSPDGYGLTQGGLAPVSPDGTQLIVVGDHKYGIMSTAGGAFRPLRGLDPDERIMGWSRDPRSLLARTNSLPMTLFRLDLVTAKRTPILTYQPSDATGLLRVRSVHATPDGNLFAFSYVRQLSNLYLVAGVR